MGNCSVREGDSCMMRFLCHLANQKLKRQCDTFLPLHPTRLPDMAGDNFQQREKEETEKSELRKHK